MNIMKSLTKNIIVYLNSENITEHEVDVDLFEDPFFEAITRAIESRNKNIHIKVRSTATCWEKQTPKIKHCINSYWTMINAGLYAKAELLREKVKVQNDVDLAKEPIHVIIPIVNGK